MRIYIEDIIIVNTFIREWQEYLGEIEKGIIKFEQSTDDDVLFDNVFRYVHCIKEGSSFIGLFCITKSCYEIEITLEGLKSHKLTADTELIDSLLSVVDYLNDYIIDLSQKLKENISADIKNNEYLNYENEKKEQPILENLNLTREKCEVTEKKQEDCSQETGFEILQTEEFKQGLSEGLKEQFLLESSENVETIENDVLIRLDNNSDDREAVNEIFRAVHTIKGSIGIYLSTVAPQTPVYNYLKKFSDVVHTFESLLSLIRDKGYKFEKNLIDLSLLVMDSIKLYLNSIEEEKFDELPDDDDVYNELKQQVAYFQNLSNGTASGAVMPVKKDTVNKKEAVKVKGSAIQSIRVNQKKIDKIMNVISELIIAKNSFVHISSKLDMEYNLPEMSKEIKKVGSSVNRISDELQNAIISIRMVEVKTVFQKMPRVVRDIAQSTGKKMKLFMEGESTEIDKTIIERIGDPLVHMIRNAADHGIESSEKRLEQGKPEIGKIVLRAYNKNKYVYIEIEDDGKGLDSDEIKKKALQKGFINENEADKLSHNQLLNLIFLPGFSTAKKITEVSGRGVGMDIVKSNISKINGNITIQSHKGEGTKMVIQLPLTLAISRGLIVEVSGDSYIFPLEYIFETLKIKRCDIHEFEGNYFTYTRGEIIGVDWLSRVFFCGKIDNETDELNAVIITNGAEKYAIIVDKLKSEQEFVVKTLDGQLSSIPGISGSTLLGDGKVVLIVNPPDLLKLRHEKFDLKQ